MPIFLAPNKKFWSLLFFLTIFSIAVWSSDYTLIEDKGNLPILTTSLSQQKTLKIRLNNGLEAYIVSDPGVDKASAAMTVRVGSWEELSMYPGLAHFLEHMLFLGTKKYPKESEYDRFVTEHGGTSNAFTMNDYTSYMFDIDNTAFETALDMFSNFFKEPLFNPSGVSRELQAIDQEYAKNLENDNVREAYVLKENADPTHPYHSFNAGNSASLAKVSQDALKDFYHSHYSSNLMRLVVISPDPLDKLLEMVIQDFKDVPNLNKSLYDLNAPTFPSNREKEIIYIEPIKNIRSVMLLWDLPSKFSHMIETKPEGVVCYVLGHEGKESLLAELKKEKLAEGLQCGTLQAGPNTTYFYVNIDLTEEGIHQLETVLIRFFQTLAMFKEKGVPQYLFDEVQGVAKIRYQYQGREDTFQAIMKHANRLAHEDMDTYPVYSEVIQSFDPASIRELLHFLTPQNMIIDVVAPSALTNVIPDRKEQWNGVAYAKRPFPKTLLAKLNEAKPHANIQLPEPNPFIPKNLGLVNGTLKEPLKRSIVPHAVPVVDNEKGKIYFAKDTQFLIPKVGWIFEIKTPEINSNDPSKVVLGDLFIKTVKEALNTLSYPAQIAGLNYEMSRSDDGINLSIEGYSENASKLLESILQNLQNSSIQENQFNIYKDYQLREYQNAAKESPLQQASEVIKSIIYKRFSSSQQKGQALQKVTFNQFQNYLQNVLSKVYIQGVLYGNMTEENAKQTAELILSTLKGKPYFVSEQPKIDVIVLPKQGGPFYVQKKIHAQGNATALAIEIPEFTLQKRSIQQVMMQAIGEPFFAELRTRQQTGYIVYQSPEDIERHLFNFFVVQSNTHDPRDLLARFELFIESYLQELPTHVTEERFNKIRDALLINLQQPAKNIKGMSELIYQLAFKFNADFDWMEKRVLALKELKYEEFLKLSPQFFGRQNKRRFAVLLEGNLPLENIFRYVELKNVDQLRDLSEYTPRN